MECHHEISECKITGKTRRKAGGTTYAFDSISFFTTIAGFNVHLDAQLKLLKAKIFFDLNSTFNIQTVA
jgi:hypothetical protein